MSEKASTETRRRQEVAINSIVKSGDVIYRYGHAEHYEPLLGKTSRSVSIGAGIQFSRMLCDLPEPACPYSHAAIIEVVKKGDVRIWDMSNEGLRRFELRDWLRECYDLGRMEIRRLLPEHSIKAKDAVKLLTKIRDEMDPEYDFEFEIEDEEFSCVEMVKYVYERCGVEMPPRMDLTKLPNWSWLHTAISVVGGIDATKVNHPGNDEFGLRSSDKFTVVYQDEGDN